MMKEILLRWLACYDAWCEQWGLTRENRRCCVPVRYDNDAVKDRVCAEAEEAELNQQCGSARR